MLTYISVQDILRRAFTLWSLAFLGIITLCLNPASFLSMLAYLAGFSFLKYAVEWWRQKPYIGIGDVEVLAILSSQTQEIEWFFIISGCLGAIYCVAFKRDGLPFVPVMSIAWCIVEGVSAIL
jgi:hypothetical protein